MGFTAAAKDESVVLAADATLDGATVLLRRFTVTHSTIYGNMADADADGNGIGGGIAHTNAMFGISTLDHAIVAANLRGMSTRDDISAPIAATYSLIGDDTGATITDNSGNLIGTSGAPIDLLLGPLANNGGPTMTHALLAGSPAIDAGDPAAVPGGGTVPLFDQRGNSYGRVQNGRIDIGAFEVRDTLSADFDSSGFINGLDFLLWQRGFGTSAPDAVKTDGDADNDLDSDSNDLDIWALQFGTAAPVVATVGELLESVFG